MNPVLHRFLTATLRLITLAVVTFSAGSSTEDPGDIRFKRLSVEQGLSQSSVLSILRDREGFMWFATQDGLNRFDGYNFTVYRHKEQDSLSIADNYINCLYEDTRGNLWVGTYNCGVDRYDRERDAFIHFPASPSHSDGRTGNIAMNICEDRAGRIWVATWGGGLNMLEPGDTVWHHFRHDPSDPASLVSDLVSSVAADSAGRLWVGTWAGLDRTASADGRFTHFREGNGPVGLPENRIVSLFVDRGGNVWAGTFEHGIAEFPAGNDVAARAGVAGESRYALPSALIGPISQDRNGVLWIGTRDAGIIRLDPETGTVWSHRSNDQDVTSVGANTILSAWADPAGGIWIGTGGGGVSHYDPCRFKFKHLHHEAGNPQSLSSNSIHAIREDRYGSLWIGTMGEGLDRLDLHSGRILHYRAAPRRPGGISSNDLLGLMEDREGNIWAGTNGAGLNKFDRRTNTFRRLRHNPADSSSIPSDYVMAMLQAKDGSIWAGTVGGGLARLDPQTLRCTRYVRSRSWQHLSGNYIYALLEDDSGTLWIGTWGAGLTLFDPKAQTWKTYQHQSTDPGSLSNNTILALYQGHNGTVWIGTQGGGLDRFDRLSGTFRHLTESEGLPNNVVYGILEDPDHRFWLSTNRGICCYDPITGSVRSYGLEDGLQNLEFNQGAWCQGSGGRMYFGGINGVNVFSPEQMPVDTLVPPVRITQVKVLDRKVPLGQGHEPAVEIAYDENMISFEFAVLDYTTPAQNNFRYRLEGFDKEWRSSGKRHDASYTNLESGTYVFHAIGSNGDGLWNNEGARVTVIVRPPFWETVWFRSIAALSLLAMGFTFYRGRLRRQEHERALQTEFSRKLNEFQEKERKRIAGELHDGLGQDLLMIRNRLAQCEAPAPLKPENPGEIHDIGCAVQQAIENVREISADLHPHMLDRLGLTRTIEAMLRSCAKASGLHIAAKLDPVDRLFAPSEEINLYRIIQEGVNNVVKHSHASECRVKIRRQNGHAEIRIEDDGCGFQQSPQTEPETMTGGSGLINMAERSRLLGGQLAIQSTPGTGTTIVLRIPLPIHQPDASHARNA